MKYKAFTLNNFKSIPQINNLTSGEITSVEVVSQILPFKTNNYVVNELIDWEDYKNDPLFILNFPQKDMVHAKDFNTISSLMHQSGNDKNINREISRIRSEMNPHPAGQIEYNVPVLNHQRLMGMQHKYKETLLFFPSQGQTCHAYCTFCFRWPQFIGQDELKFALKETDLLINYLKAHEEITDLLITGGDPMIMRAEILDRYISQILKADIAHLKTIRIGSKSLTFWPYRFITDPDADDILRTFEKVKKAGKSLAFMAHFNHPRELETQALEKAVKRILNTGAQIRTQAPLLDHINAHEDIWSNLWQKQVNLGMIPYYMFIARNTGANDYFGIPLSQAWSIFKGAFKKVSGISRTVRGPIMSCMPGKIRVVGITEINNQKVFVLEFIQGRNPEWVGQPFFAQFNKHAMWYDELEPALGKTQFFFEEFMDDLFIRA